VDEDASLASAVKVARERERERSASAGPARQQAAAFYGDSWPAAAREARARQPADEARGHEIDRQRAPQPTPDNLRESQR